MRGKRPKDRDSYVLRMSDGTLVEVTREVYLEWYQSRRREKYQKEKNKKYGVCSLEQLAETGGYAIPVKDSLEETVIRNICRDKIRKVLEELPEPDVYLIHLLYFEEVSVSKAAQICGCSRKTIQNRKKRILEELSQKMYRNGIVGGSF